MARLGGSLISAGQGVRGRLIATAAVMAVCCAVVCAPLARANDSDTVSKADLQKVLDDLELQKKKLADQEKALTEQQHIIANQQNQLNFLKGQVGLPSDAESVPVMYNLGNSVPSGTVSGVTPAQDQSKPVGEAPISSRPEIAIIPEQGGVLTHRGQVVVEPSIQYTHTSQDRFFFQGFEVVDTVLIGLIEATKADRNTVEAAIGARVGVTDRLELEARIPYVYRDDQISREIVSAGPAAAAIQSGATGNNIGDIEFAAHYDFTNLIFDAPYNVFTIANLKVKTPTGESPFDVPLDVNGDPTRLATGSGFWAVQPSLTAIFPSDPVVFFGSVGYTINIGEDINKTFTGTPNCSDPSNPATCPGTTTTNIGFVDPGDSVNTSIGLGLSLNERASISLGFSFDYVMETTQKVSGGVTGTLKSDPLYVGEFLVGGSYAISDSVALNLNFEVGATEAAPDFQAMLRVPIRFNVF
jgi:hypothetical protein